ncbi:filamin-A [Elysia marginata]|uniref:Filamin-A n=1 Tax=Elysia marginata TaxID=1093978 RepID=A0AAV4GD85_9GAST|nr:filamin-A [Elysia marginata]
MKSHNMVSSSPNAIAKCSIDPLPDGQYKVTYIPVEVGLFSVNVRWNGKEIPGSPFHPQVVDARKVKVVGGWQHYMDGNERIHLVVGEEKRIPFDTSEAGPGQLRAEVKSPSSFLPVQVDDEHKGRSTVVFTPREEGTHYLNLYWSDHPLVNSPYIGYATSGVADPSKVWLTGRGLKEAIVREEAEFVIDGSQAGPGEPDVALTGVRAEIQVFTTPLGGGKFRCTYIPVIPGAYLLNISWNGRQLRGAPYKVNVIGASYPDRVIVTGEGLRGGLLGQSLDFRIDTKKAGPGELTAYCMGPSQVAYCELGDHHDGTYRLVVRPQETGRHVLQIKYGGVHVQGSPFAFRVSAQPDASKVRVSGPGVEHGILANFHSEFIVETRGAGAGQLTVRIRGPKGAFQVEMYRESQKDRKILCRYYPTSTGKYIINVRWSDVDVPGSPFHVYILDTHHELEQVLHDQSFGAGYTNALQHNSFHNTSLNSSHHNTSFQQPRYTAVQQNGGALGGHPHHHQTHNVSRSSGYYQWAEAM